MGLENLRTEEEVKVKDEAEDFQNVSFASPRSLFFYTRDLGFEVGRRGQVENLSLDSHSLFFLGTDLSFRNEVVPRLLARGSIIRTEKKEVNRTSKFIER